jgi:hypothetical protein
VRRDPAFGGAYNTLGVVYLRHGDLAEAERAVRARPRCRREGHARARQPRRGPTREEAAPPMPRRLGRRLAALEPHPPFYFFDLGMAAIERGDWRGARELFAREVARADTNPEFHFWLGVADWRLGEESAAMRQLALAMNNSLTRDQHRLYAAKLAWLQAHRQP